MGTVEGCGYVLSDMDTVYRVDETFPAAQVDLLGCWIAEENPTYGPIVGMQDPNQIVAVFSSDRRYYPGLIAAFLSFKRYHSDIHTVILDCGLSQPQVRYLQQYAEVVASRNYLPDIPAWARFEVSLLPYRRVVYLDSDIIVLKRLTDFFESQAEFAAVKNLDWTVSENFTQPNVLEKYHIDPSTPAFFAGGFSLDNQIWGQGRLLNEAMRVYHEVGDIFAYADQSALQIIMHSRRAVTFLGDEYNAIAELWDWDNQESAARVIHYAGDEIKPWNPLCKYPRLDYFFAYSKIRRVEKSSSKQREGNAFHG